MKMIIKIIIKLDKGVKTIMVRFFVFAITILFFVTLSYADTLSDKIQQLEEKIQELEKQLASLKQEPSSSEIEELHRQLAILASEVEKLRSGESDIELEDARRRSLGLGLSAASVYTKKQGVSIAGYGEMLYENFSQETESGTPSGKTDQIDLLRAIVYFGYRFNDRILFNSEIEYEHAGEEVSVEFAHIDYMLNDDFTLRGGMVLIPMGFVNELHEPTVFLGTRRPVVESVIIPSTWRENGFGIVGRKGMFDFRAYLINGMNATGFSSSGLRNGRQKGSLAKIKNPSVVVRADVTPSAGLLFGGSIYAGDSGFFGVSPSELDVTTVIGEAHAEYKRHGLELRGLYAHASLDNITELNQSLGFTGNSSIGETLQGGYLQAGFNVWSGRAGGAALTPYVRYEVVNTQDEIPSGFSKNPARDQSIWTVGVELRPIFNVVIKTDFQNISNKANSGINQWNLALGYSF